MCEERVGAEHRQKSEERNTNREGVASGSATNNFICIFLFFYYNAFVMGLFSYIIVKDNNEASGILNAKNIDEMFYGCSSLQSIDLGCSSLKKENVKIGSYGEKILDALKYVKNN